ncbi:sulfatase-like hydrolase/transferase [Rhizobium sp. L1K21]|uniref:sulfatase-like hydrolase/transferase n=1 Tax=Rhizobium sp. L1K21 TaxID=2954933 RepID=UPI002092735C|nr:sulfatase-like hydrolase/transferase [Rhizobium sp. L1K21]MCO6186718.1 hypothetical protein [Rhizobium sp. L1K21]
MKIYAFLSNIVVALCIGALFFVMVYVFDTRWRFIPYTLATTATLGALLFVVSRRFFASNYAAALIIFGLTLVSTAKFHFIGFALHAYDFIFSGTDVWSMVFVAKAFPLLTAGAVVALVLIVFFIIGFFRYERPVGIPAGVRAIPVFIFAAVAYFTHPMHNPREADYLPYIAGYNASAFPLSLLYLPDMLRPVPLQKATEDLGAVSPLPDSVRCNATGKNPDIFMVLAESQATPELFPDIRFPKATIDSFRSGDGVLRSLFVETVGAGTWMTNFSVLSGLSTREFGWRAAYVTQLMEGRIKGALPDILSRCGYRTVVLIPFAFNALNEGRFLSSIGFQEVYDADATGIDPLTADDEAYFDFARKLTIEHRRKNGDQPLFIHIQTMFSHQPYDTIQRPDIKLQGDGPLAKNTMASEYARRVIISRRDFDRFHDWVSSEPGPQGSVLVEFGDHQATATEALVLKDRNKQAVLIQPQSDIYRTYYSVHGYGHAIDYDTLPETLDSGFLAADLLAAADLVNSPQFENLSALSKTCQGRFYSCINRDAVQSDLKARIDGGLIVVE